MIRIKDIIILDEVTGDLNDGKAFYDRAESNLGDYFWDSSITDIESLYLFAGIPNAAQCCKQIPFFTQRRKARKVLILCFSWRSLRLCVRLLKYFV